MSAETRISGGGAKLGWGLLGAGSIARTFARALGASLTGRALAVASRAQDKAERFGAKFDVPRRYGSYEAMLADPEINAVYVATPHPCHAEWAIRAAEAGKHVLCEKPLTLNCAEAVAVVEAARRAGVFLMEAFMYRCHPQTARLVELLRAKAIGEVRVIQASFGYAAAFDPESLAFNNALGGGGILDVGCYPVSMARLLAGAATGEDFAEPLEVRGAAHLGATGVDEYASAIMKFPGDIVAELASAVTVSRENSVRILGSAGSIFVANPWVCNQTGPDRPEIVVRRRKVKEPETIGVPAEVSTYALEADAFAEGVERGRAPHPAMSIEDTLGNMKALDRWREAVGLVYDSEKR